MLRILGSLQMRQNLLSWCTSWVEHWLLPPPWLFYWLFFSTRWAKETTSNHVLEKSAAFDSFYSLIWTFKWDCCFCILHSGHQQARLSIPSVQVCSLCVAYIAIKITINKISVHSTFNVYFIYFVFSFQILATIFCDKNVITFWSASQICLHLKFFPWVPTEIASTWLVFHYNQVPSNVHRRSL